MRYFSILIGLALTACASAGPGQWSASSWNGLAAQTFGNAGYQYHAAPIKGQGFKLKFSVKTNGNFGVSSAEPPSDDAIETAAREAAPEGCSFVSLERTPDGGAEASYDCD